MNGEKFMVSWPSGQEIFENSWGKYPEKCGRIIRNEVYPCGLEEF
jgi:hypothetical protein